MWIGNDKSKWSKRAIKKYEAFLTKQNGFKIEIVPFFEYSPEGKAAVTVPPEILHYLSNAGLFAQEKEKK